ncbi:cutinase [Rhizoctonia solani AG-3 Rhs1AP]|uniref:Cutinase n=1 Tax=Rhizoctonia solani AG-3 Rhs1AP TaxID=1086054 RepID=X8JF80_9AGAM|nr:cutinase [Rhizoctonia solani AG-3 Rhs1AP]
MHAKTLVASLLLAVSALAAPTEFETRQSCSKSQLVFLAGTNEEGLGLAGDPLSKGLGSGFTTYSVPYDTQAEYSTTITAGAKLVVNYITAQAARCPNQVFALGGYSKGAMVVHSTTLSAALKAKVKAIVVFGDPYRGSSNAWPINSPVVDSAPRDGSTASQNVASFCNSGDLFCAGGSSIPAHLAYGTDGSTGVAATFIKNKVA